MLYQGGMRVVGPQPATKGVEHGDIESCSEPHSGNRNGRITEEEELVQALCAGEIGSRSGHRSGAYRNKDGPYDTKCPRPNRRNRDIGVVSVGNSRANLRIRGIVLCLRV